MFFNWPVNVALTTHWECYWTWNRHGGTDPAPAEFTLNKHAYGCCPAIHLVTVDFINGALITGTLRLILLSHGITTLWLAS
jgi:hypothetical protein